MSKNCLLELLNVGRLRKPSASNLRAENVSKLLLYYYYFTCKSAIWAPVILRSVSVLYPKRNAAERIANICLYINSPRSLG